jgi:aspartyl-tRNA(Asn)/glutamyl-tRNA(Gln) amidotransferase subunit A
VRQALTRVRNQLAADGHRLRTVTVDDAGRTADVYLHIVLPEASWYHVPMLEHFAERYSPGVRSRLEMGRYVMAEDYARALRGRELIRIEVSAAMNGLDGLLLPAMAIPAPKIGVPMVRIGTTEEPVRNVMLRCTQAFNLSGHAAISLPCGSTTDGWPVGAQLVGAETTALLAVASRVESMLDVRSASPAYLGPGKSR